jgi:hypothetical protein
MTGSQAIRVNPIPSFRLSGLTPKVDSFAQVGIEKVSVILLEGKN